MNRIWDNFHAENVIKSINYVDCYFPRQVGSLLLHFHFLSYLVSCLSKGIHCNVGGEGVLSS